MSETPSTNYSVIQPHTSESEQSLSVRPFNVTEPVTAKRICFYKSGDPQFNGVKMVVNSRSFKSFDALLDNLSKRVPLPFGVRNITTPRGIHSINHLEDLEDGKSYICSQQRKVKPINLEMASKKPLPWQISRPISGRRRAVQLARESEGGVFQRAGALRISTPKKLLVFRNGNVRIRRTIVLGKKNTHNFEALLDHISELMQYPVLKLYATDGRKVPSLQALMLCSGAVVAAGREPFKAGNYDPHRYSLPSKLPGVSNRVYPRTNAKSEGRKRSVQIDSSSRSQLFSASSYKGYSYDNNSESSYVPDNDNGLAGNHSHTGEDFFVVPPADDIEKSVHLNQDGSMTVEMRVRFNIKEEETIKWTTSVSRAGASAVIAEDQSSELNVLTCKIPTQDFNSVEDNVSLQQISTEVTNQDSPCRMETGNYDIWQNPSMNIDLSQANNDNVKPGFYRPPTPGPRRVRQKKALVESVTVVSDTAVQKKMVEQYSYNEEMDNGETKSEYCVVTHASSKTSSVTTPKLSEECSNHMLKQLQNDHTEEQMLNKGTVKRSTDLPDEDSILQNVLEKSVVEEGLYNSLTSGCDSSNSHAQSYLKKYHASGPALPNQSGTTQKEHSSFNNHSEWSQSKSEEMICKQCKVLHSSQGSRHSTFLESNRTVCTCGEMTPTVTGSSSIMAKNGSAECITATHLSDESQAASSSSKKKKKKKKKKKRKSSLDTMEQDAGSQQNLHDISVEGTTENEVKTCEMHITADSTQHLSTQITVHKKVLAFPVGNSDVSNENIGAKEDLHSHFSVKSQQNVLASNLKKNLNRHLPKLKTTSEKKHNLPPSTKTEEGLLLVKDCSKNKIKQIKVSARDTANGIEQTSTHFASLRPLTETGLKVETEKGKLTSDKLYKSLMKNQKSKKNKEIESNKGSVLDETKMLDALRHTDFSDRITEYSLENYVQNWLQNIFPNEKHLAPINSNDGKMCQLSVQTFSDKESQLVGKNVYLTGKNNISEGKQSNSTLNHLSEIRAVEESVKELYERQIGCLTNVDASLIEEAKNLLESDIWNNTKLSMSNIMHENDKKKVQIEADHQRHCSEVAAQVHPKAINNILGTDVQKDCVSGLLLHELKSAILKAEKNSIGCVEKPFCLMDISSPSLLGSSSNLLLAWFLLLNLKESLFNINKDDMVQTTCSCSEIVRLLQYLKQVAVNEEADEDLKTAACNLQVCTASCLVSSGMQTENQEAPYYEKNISLVEIKNIPGFEEQGKLSNVILNDRLSSEEGVDAKELSEELERSTEDQKNYSMPAENSELNDLLQNLDCAKAQSDNCGLNSNEELPKENEDSSLQDSQGKATDSLFNNEESELSEEPNSTIHSITSHDKDHTSDVETSELDDKELKSTEEQGCAETLQKKKNSSKYLSSGSENATEGDRFENSVQGDREEDGGCEETSEQFSSPSPLSFCYESKQILSDACEEEPTSRVKLIVKELECGSHSKSSLKFKKCLKSPATSDLSDYRPETDESDDNFRHSSDLTNGSTDEAIYEKEYNKGYVKRTIERFYGKADASSKLTPKPGPPYLAQMLQRDTEESFYTVREEAPLFCQAHNTWSDDKMSSLLISHEIPEDLNKSSDMWEKENATLPAPQFSLNGEEAYYNDENPMQYTNQHSQTRAAIAEDEGVLIDKGKWLLKENHLIRRSPPENTGMYGNTDTMSADTAFDNHSDDIPYSHFGNLDVRLPLKEISSSELEEMAKPCDNECSYFNMPHNSDSEPFPDALSIKSKNSQYETTLLFEARTKVCTTSTHVVAEVNSSPPTFTSVEFRLPDNKVHPEGHSPNDEPIQSQPIGHANLNRNIHEDQDSLDKLHAICGQHCPILTAIIKPTNEKIRGCAYRKASDVENQVGLMNLLMDTPYFKRQGKNEIGLDKNHAQLKNSCINKIANNIFDRLYANNTLDFINSNNFRLNLSLKGNLDFKKTYVTENMGVDAQKMNNHGNKEALHDMTIGLSSNLSALQSSRGSVNPMIGEKTAPSFAVVREGCNSETFCHQETALNYMDWKGTVNVEGGNGHNNKEETLSHVIEEESGNEHSDS